MVLLHTLHFTANYNTQYIRLPVLFYYKNPFAFISSSLNSCYKFVFTFEYISCKILLIALDIVVCLNFLYVRTYMNGVMALSVSIMSTSFHWIFFFKITIQTKLYTSCI